MKMLPAFLFLGLFILWTELSSTSFFWIPLALSRICLENPFWCSMPGIIFHCRSDYDCPRNLRCCNFRCGRACRIPPPAPVIPWSCPRNPIKCTVAGIDRCRHDSDCPRKQRCCYYNCARICR